MKLLRALGSLAVLAALLLGVPLLLMAWGDPLSLLSVDWRAALTRPDDGTIVLGLLSLSGWIIWLFLLVTTVIEAVGVLGHRQISFALPGTGFIRPALQALVAASLAPFLGLTTVAQADDETPAQPATFAPQTPGQPDDPIAETAPGTTAHDYVIQPGDELWSLAEQHLGSGERWREILALNPGLSATSELMPGSVVRLPLEVQEESPEEAPPATPAQSVEVERGDTLWDLAEEHLGDPHRWPELHRANLDRIQDPDQIDVGWILTVPHAEVVPEEASPGLDEDPEETVRLEASPDPGNHADIPPASDAGPMDERSAPDPAGGEPDQEAAQDHDAAQDQGAAGIIGPIGGVLAAGLFVSIAARRRTQLLHRAVGSRLIPFTPTLQRFVSALGRTAESGTDETAGESPTTVMVGWHDGQPLHVDLETAGLTVVAGEPGLTHGFTAGVLTAVMCCPWSTSVNVTAVQPDQSWDSALDDPRLQSQDDIAEALTALQQLVARRRIAMRDRTLAQVRQDPDLAEAFAPHLVVFCSPVEPAHLQRIRDCLSLGQVGVSVLAGVAEPPSPPGASSHILLKDDESALLNGAEFSPQLLDRPARRAIVELFAASLDPASEPAPWWRDEALPSNISVLPRRRADLDQEDIMPPWDDNPDHPTLLLLGEVDLLGCRGRRPARAVVQCVEYCAWLLEHPGASPTTMARDLVVAETTRRSNMSRLRTWLGGSPAGEPYLPDAYSGHITLHEEVTSDWERFQVLLSGGVNLASDAALRAALSLVRGEPLQQVSFQWPWAQQLRDEMISMITDAAVVLADRYLHRGDLEEVHWALSQGRKAAGVDETLTVREIQALALGGDRPGVDRAVRQLTRAARVQGRDLSPDTARRIQHALHTVLTAADASS